MSGKVMDHILLEGMCRHMDDREVVKRQPHGFVKGKSDLIQCPFVMQ